jgi:hypothetical protein
MSKVIQWKTGSKFSGSAEGAHKELEKIRKRQGNLTPSAVVEKARSKSSPLHRHFEWDDVKAAEIQRNERARSMIRSIEIIHVEAPSAPVRAYSTTTVPTQGPKEKPKRVYTSTEEALADPVQRDEILGQAIRDAIAFRRKYAALQELSKVFSAMDDLVSNFNG